MWLRILSTALEKELKVLDYAYWLHYCYLVSLDCFPLFQPFSLLWLNWFFDYSFPQAKGRQRTWSGGQDHTPLLFSVAMAFHLDLGTGVHGGCDRLWFTLQVTKLMLTGVVTSVAREGWTRCRTQVVSVLGAFLQMQNSTAAWNVARCWE